ncbi:methyltransferase family protein [Algoriphagus boseongensis]|uniref:Methyltransferase family protein n=1 Tax=Algoriphagus boseongensis TaxID=1442587 RepID=A0A4R6T6Z6_9BACT|nr:class I SAM-dependent methyltransferase [Algoriphagus boseongensis]TDQ16975.1 methyltransferase family protein [Algoriphagus boseongensis]
MRQITCPICNSAPANHPNSFEIIPCTSCGVNWTYIPEELDTDSLYRDEVYAVVDNRKSVFEKIIFSEAKKVLHQAKKLNPQASKLLDFGSGKGQFLAQAQAEGWKVLGVETEKSRADFAKENYKVPVFNSFYEGGKIQGGQFDFLTLNHVLEHLPKPISLLEELVSQNLEENGILYIEVPRADSWQAKLAGKSWMHWDIPKHLTHWTEPVLEQQLAKIGFQKVGIRSYSIHLGVLGMLQALLSRLGFRDNLILRLKRKKTLGLILGIGLLLPFAWILEVLSVAFRKSGIFGIYFRRNA